MVENESLLKNLMLNCEESQSKVHQAYGTVVNVKENIQKPILYLTKLVQVTFLYIQPGGTSTQEEGQYTCLPEKNSGADASDNSTSCVFYDILYFEYRFPG